jgi:hypothetical protein
VRLRIASSTTSWSTVGGWTSSAKPLKATIPIWAPGCCSTNCSAAASAARRRVGAMSVEHIDPDTSIARMIVIWLVGTLTMAAGRAAATASTPTATTSSAKGTWRRTPDQRATAGRTRARLLYRTPIGRRRRSPQA